MTGPSSLGVTAGNSFNVTIKVEDWFGNVADVDWPCTLTASDGQNVIVSPITLNDGEATASVTLDKADSVTLTASINSGRAVGTSAAFPGSMARRRSRSQ